MHRSHVSVKGLETQDQHYNEELVAAYVSRLKGRRVEENASRKMRSQRRADTVNANMEDFKKRSVQQRRKHMNEKLQMTSQIESHLFSMLDEQSKWRHVMYQNVVEQENYLHLMEQQHQEFDRGYLQGLVTEEQEVFEEVVVDDCNRWEDLHRQQKEEQDNELKQFAGHIVTDVLSLAEKVIEFNDLHDLATDPPLESLPTQGTVPSAVTPALDTTASPRPPSGAFDRVPKLIFSQWVHEVIYPTQTAKELKVLQDHIALNFAPTAHRDGFLDNGIFSALTLKLLQLQFPNPAPFQPLKTSSKAILVLYGSKYTGKSSVAREVAQQLNLWWLSDLELVQAALNEIEREINDAADLLDPQEVVRGELLDIGVEIRRALHDGGAVGEELMARLVLNRIAAVEFTEYDGILFETAPSSRAMFESVEKTLCGYQPDRREEIPKKLLAPVISVMPEPTDPLFSVDRPPTPPVQETKEGKKGEAQRPKKERGKKDEVEEPLPPIDLPVVDPVPPLTEEEEAVLRNAQSTRDRFGTHAVIRLEAAAQELFKRYSGLRTDVDDNAVYHLIENPPPLQRMSRIRSIDRVDADTANLHALIAKVETESNPLTQWLQRYTTVASINAQKPIQEVVKSVMTVAESTISAVQRDHEVRVAAETLLAQRKELEELFLERTATKETVRKNLLAIYTERGVDPIPAELLEPPVVKPEGESRSLPVPPGLPALYLKMLDDFTDYYSKGIYRIHTEAAKLMEALYAEGKHCVHQFEAFWKMKDTKQPLLNAFIEEFNTMQPALRRDVQGKEELHLRTDVLCESLWHVAEKRRDEANAVVEQLLNRSTFIDLWSDAMRILGGALVQLELERFYLVKQLSLLYYNGLRLDPAAVFDETELTTEIIPLPRGSAGEVNTPADNLKAKDKAKPPPKKPSSKPSADARPSTATEELGDHPKVDDHFAGVVEKAVVVMRQTTERLSGPATPVPVNPKDKKKAAQEVSATPDIPTSGSLAAPLVQAEFELAKVRMETIGKHIHHLIDEGYKRHSNMLRVKMQNRLRNQFLDEMAAVNGAVFQIRTAIEEERPVQHAIVLEGPTFAIDYGHPLVPPRAAVAAGTSPLSDVGIRRVASLGQAGFDLETDDPKLTSVLSIKRAYELIAVFKKIAPDFLLYREDFLKVVRLSDYDCVKPSAPPEIIFQRFDLLGCGAIDWREFIVHLLFFVEPQLLSTENSPIVNTPKAFGGSAQPRNPYFVETPSLFQLYDFRNDLGNELLTRDVYDEIPFFFETQLEEDRLEAYRDVLWELFSRQSLESEGFKPTVQILDPNVMVLFFCADEQPLRGIQKAFAMAAPVADENCSLNVEQLTTVFHFNACHPGKLLMDDPYDQESLHSVFILNGGSTTETLTFQEACSTQNGRILFNHTFLYRKRDFKADA